MSEVKFLTGPQVQARYQKSHVTIWRWVRDPALGFPKPVILASHLHWDIADLEAWEAAQAEKSKACDYTAKPWINEIHAKAREGKNAS